LLEAAVEGVPEYGERLEADGVKVDKHDEEEHSVLVATAVDVIVEASAIIVTVTT
jgi:hypothetical protein